MRRYAFALFAGLASTAAAAEPVALSGALPERTIRAAMEMAEVPGLAVTVLRRGAPAVTRAFGRRDVARDLPVTPRTVFAVGSISKTFTVAALSMLADTGRLDWDAPVRRYAPDLRVASGPLADVATVRDLITHRTGMPRHDALWYLHAYDRAGLLRRLRYLRPAVPPRTVFAYSNLMVAAAGRVLSRIEGAEWETVVWRRLLAPLGMTRTRLGLAGFRAASDRASPYFPGDNGREDIPLRDTDPIAPAAAVYTDAVELGRFLQMLMNGGVFGGKRLLSERAVGAMRTKQIATGRHRSYPELGPIDYGMGLYLSRYRGHALAYHPGVIDGYAAMISFLPADGLGVAVLSNLSGSNPVPAIASYAIYDRLLGLRPIDWLGRLRARIAARANRQPTAAPEPLGPPLHPLAGYAGEYGHPAYGRIGIRASGDPADPNAALSGALHGIRFALVPAGGDAWQVAETAWPLRAGLRFLFGFDGGTQAVRITTPLADGPTYRLQAGDMVFTRVQKSGGGGRPALQPR